MLPSRPTRRSKSFQPAIAAASDVELRSIPVTLMTTPRKEKRTTFNRMFPPSPKIELSPFETQPSSHPTMCLRLLSRKEPSRHRSRDSSSVVRARQSTRSTSDWPHSKMDINPTVSSTFRDLSSSILSNCSDIPAFFALSSATMTRTSTPVLSERHRTVLFTVISFPWVFIKIRLSLHGEPP